VPTDTLTSKGQITIPVQVRTVLGLDAGDRIEFVELQKGQFAVIPATRSLKELKGGFATREKDTP
jgi:antitoxin PrlF